MGWGTNLNLAKVSMWRLARLIHVTRGDRGLDAWGWLLDGWLFDMFHRLDAIGQVCFLCFDVRLSLMLMLMLILLMLVIRRGV